MFSLVKRHKRWSGLGAFLLISATAAFAAWMISGQNSDGGGKIGSLAAPTVTAGTSTDALYPDLVKHSLSFQVNNPNPGPLTLVDASFVGGSITPTNDVTGLTGTCATEESTNDIVKLYPNHSLSIAIPAGTTTTVTVPNVVALDTTAPSSCQGQSFTGKLALSYQSG